MESAVLEGAEIAAVLGQISSCILLGRAARPRIGYQRHHMDGMQHDGHDEYGQQQTH